jgi:hypothetical protein
MRIMVAVSALNSSRDAVREEADMMIPTARAWRGVMRPLGTGLSDVLLILESMSRSR